MAEILKDVLEATVKENDNIQKIIEDMKFLFDLDRSYGIWLDMLGELVGETPRIWEGGIPDISDSEYQDRIRVKITLNGGFGTIENILMAIRRYSLLDHSNGYWTDVENVKVLTTQYWANVLAEVYEGNQDLVNNIGDHICAGVGLQLITIPKNVFTIGDDTGTVTEPGKSGGLGDENDPDAGGALAELLI